MGPSVQAQFEEQRMKALRRLSERKQTEAAEKERERAAREKARTDREERRTRELESMEQQRARSYAKNAVMVLQEQGEWRRFIEGPKKGD